MQEWEKYGTYGCQEIQKIRLANIDEKRPEMSFTPWKISLRRGGNPG